MLFWKPAAMVAMLMFVTAADAAEVTSLGTDTQGRSFFRVSGDLERGDTERFLTATDGKANAVILLESDGGHLQTGLDIGSLIRMRGYETAVQDGQSCYSACALAWLGGAKRIIGEDAHVRFHAAYVVEDGNARESGVGNALVGAYLSKLGLNEQAVVFLTSAPPDDFNDLDAEWSEKIGIDVEFSSTRLMLFGLNTSEALEDPDLSARKAWEELDEEIISFILAEAEDGDVEAQWTIGFLYLTGVNNYVPENAEEAVYWLKAAASQDHPASQFNLYLIYLRYGAVSLDKDAAGEYLLQAAKNGLKEADVALAETYLFGGIFEKNDEEAVTYLRKLAEANDAWAQHNLAMMLLDGRGADVDEKGAAALLRRSAENGYVNAQFRLGLAYMNAQGVPVDYEEAAAWIQKAAAADHVGAQYQLALMYGEGQGVEEDAELSAKWMSSAAINGDAFANYWVARNFSSGTGVVKNDENAVNFILKFLRSKDFRGRNGETASEIVNAFYRDWTPETIAALQRALADRGYYDKRIDGSWGPSTAAAVEAFYSAEAKNAPD